jgi:restriction system-associated AAA family ATPase
MKLLKLEIGKLSEEMQFRSLHSGFIVDFHNLSDDGISAIESFSPFCFAGLNGSGKSNVLEAISSIFFHLECCVAKFKPRNFTTYFTPHECNPDAFTLEYLIGRHNNSQYVLSNFYKITIIKKAGKAPQLFRQNFPFSLSEPLIKESLFPIKTKGSQEPAPGKIYLPDIIVGYSSGENEILSFPFRKSRFLNFDKYREDYIKQRPFEEPENSLIYIDGEMSQAVLLACMLYEDDETLKPIKDELKIVGLQSFRMNLNAQALLIDDKTTTSILSHIFDVLNNLKKCATSYFEEYKIPKGQHQEVLSSITLDFFVDDNTKRAFKEYFSTSFELFRFFQVLYELNSNFISENIKEEVYRSKGFYIDGKIPEGSPDQNVFYFLDYLLLKKIEGENEPRELLLRELSDGEHQFLHTMGICLMLKDRRSILLLDEPETHFNPSWRAQFIKILGESITAGNNKIQRNGQYNVHLLKDVLLTSHSPFIISDCMPNNVVFFDRNKKTKMVQAQKATKLGLNTYGSSVDYILKNFFKTSLISNKSFNELKDVIDNGTIEELQTAIDHFGESSEKQFLFQKIYEKMNIKDDNNVTKD